jgi:hypothetical protein
MFANPDHLFTRSGIKSARQVTYLVVPMRAITSTLCEQATTWCDAELAKEVAAAGAAGATAAAATAEAANKMFNAAILERDDLLRLYGPTLQDAVAFAYK